MRAPALWNAPTRSVPASPEHSASTSARAACSRATIASAWCSRMRPASVSSPGRGPPGRSTRRRPTSRSSVASCWLTADCVYPRAIGGAAERAVLGDRLECGQMAQLDAQPGIRFHDGNHRYVDLY